jgi:hypothetical protein
LLFKCNLYRYTEEEFYGFSKFFEDIEREFEKTSRVRDESAGPRTLWDELNTIGEEFVEFLEEVGLHSLPRVSYWTVPAAYMA